MQNAIAHKSYNNVTNAKIIVLRMKCLFICLLYGKFLTFGDCGVAGQSLSVTQSSLTPTEENLRQCSLQNEFTFGLAISYAFSSFIALIGVAVYSYKTLSSTSSGTFVSTFCICFFGACS